MVADDQQGQALSYVLGVYFGDGCVTLRKVNADGTENRCFSLQVIDRDFRDYAAERSRVAFPEATVSVFDNRRDGKGMIYMLRVERVGQMLESITGKRTIIPNSVWASADNKRAFIEGLLDSEGWITDTHYLNSGSLSCSVGFAITSELAHEFKRMIESLGVKVGKIHTKTIPSGKVAKQMHFNITSFLESGLTFHCWRKQRKIEGQRWARAALKEAAASKSPPAGVSLNDYKRSVREGLIKRLLADDGIV